MKNQRLSVWRKLLQKAIQECEMEWSNNKKLVELEGKDVRKAMPRGLPYFAVDFGMESGFAHVIEDEKLFPQSFAQVTFMNSFLYIHKYPLPAQLHSQVYTFTKPLHIFLFLCLLCLPFYSSGLQVSFNWAPPIFLTR